MITVLVIQGWYILENKKEGAYLHHRCFIYDTSNSPIGISSAGQVSTHRILQISASTSRNGVAEVQNQAERSCTKSERTKNSNHV
jgi:hypothetical protein